MSHFGIARHAALRRAWDRFCATGDAAHLRGVPAHIAGSWQRSLASGVDPGLKRFPVPEPVPVWTAPERELQAICATALRPFLDDVRDASILLTVSEKAGRTVVREGNAAALASAETINSVPGALIRESAIGTNSVGTTLFLRDGVHVDFLEHFCEGFQDWADVGVPILHPLTGELVGAVDFAVHRESLSRSMSGLARTAARAVEARLLEFELDLRRDLLRDWARRNPRGGEAAIALDRHGRIVALSDAARRLLAAEAGGDPHGRPWRDFAALRGIAAPDAAGRRPEDAQLAPVAGAGGPAGSILRLRPPAPSRGRPPADREPAGWAARFAFGHLVGAAPAFRDAVALARKVAATDLPVLIQGETGTGKEMFAHAIHAASARADGPFVVVNCGAVPAELIASELFGYEKGAFTGASATGKRGKFEQAEGGTIFLDEVTETTALLQVSLLRVLQDGVIVPVGAETPRKADVRVIAAANTDFTAALERGAFRRDLYYRLKGVSLNLPPLRRRPEDIPVLVAHFCAEAGRSVRVSPDALHALALYAWPGNVRELHAVIRAAVLLGDGGEIRLADLPAEIRAAKAPASPTEAAAIAPAAAAPLRLDAAERDGIERAMRACGGNVTEAARALGIARSSLYRKLNRLGLARDWTWRP